MTTYNVYRRELGDNNTPTVIATGLTSKSHQDATVTRGKSYLYSVGAVKGTLEKISDEIQVDAFRDWTPDDLAAQIYLNADDVGSTFTSWVDRKTGGSYVLAGSSTAPQIALLNGHKCLRFNNNAALLTSSNAILDLIKNVSSASVFIVWNKRTLDTNDIDGVLFRYGFSNNQNRFTTYSNVTGANIFGFGVRLSTAMGFSSALSTPSLVVKDKYYMSSHSFDMSSLKLSMHVDGKLLKESGFAQSGVMSSEAAISTIGGYTNVSTNAYSGSGHKGDIACIVFKTSAFTTDELHRLEGWAAHNYGLTANLPADHPYKTSAPTI